MKDIKHIMNLLKTGLLSLLILFALSPTAFAEETPGGINWGAISGLVALLGLIILIVQNLGLFEYPKMWLGIRKNGEEIQELKTELNMLKEQIAKLPCLPLTEEPTKEIEDKFDEFSRRLERLELLGVPLKPEDYFYRGIYLYYKGKFNDSLKALDKAIGLTPDFAKAWFVKGLTLVKVDRDEEALKAYEESIRLESDFADAWYHKGIVLVKIARYDDIAVEAFDKATRLKPDYTEAWFGKGVVLVNLGRYKEALDAFEKAIELKPDFAEAWSGKGAALVKLNQLDEALKAFNEAIKFKSDFAKAWYTRACVYALKGEKEKALSDLKMAIELDVKYKEKAKKDKAFKELWGDEDFKRLVE